MPKPSLCQAQQLNTEGPTLRRQLPRDSYCQTEKNGITCRPCIPKRPEIQIVRLPDHKSVSAYQTLFLFHWNIHHMKQAQKNDRVTISYTGKLENGTIFQTTTESEPLVITIGNLDVPPTLEQAIIGMSVGDKKLVKIEPDEGYGVRRKDLLQTINRNILSDQIHPQVGLILSLKVNKDGQDHHVPATVVEINDDTIVVDYNHPLAGHNLFYDITVISID
jgi:FKBP-type peptidyl-prolyl cis-trans isomerase 2